MVNTQGGQPNLKFRFGYNTGTAGFQVPDHGLSEAAQEGHAG